LASDRIQDGRGRRDGTASRRLRLERGVVVPKPSLEFPMSNEQGIHNLGQPERVPETGVLMWSRESASNGTFLGDSGSGGPESHAEVTSVDLLHLRRRAADAVRTILAGHEQDLDRKAKLGIVAAIRRVVLPPERPGRRPRASITAACEDFKAGFRGTALYQKHIPGFGRMSRWRRCVECRKLGEAVRSRLRRERKRGNPA